MTTTRTSLPMSTETPQDRTDRAMVEAASRLGTTVAGLPAHRRDAAIAGFEHFVNESSATDQGKARMREAFTALI